MAAPRFENGDRVQDHGRLQELSGNAPRAVQSTISTVSAPTTFTWSDQVNVANLLTLLNLVGGVLAAGLAVSGRLWLAFAALACAVMFDQLDGTVARATGTCDKPFGHVYEGGADLVTCGPGAAAIFFYGEMVHRALVPGAILAVMWIAAVHLRLTRYTVIGHGDTYMGCPAPLGAVILVVATLLPLGPVVTGVLAAGLAFAMVMSFPIPTAGATRAWMAGLFRSIT